MNDIKQLPRYRKKTTDKLQLMHAWYMEETWRTLKDTCLQFGYSPKYQHHLSTRFRNLGYKNKTTSGGRKKRSLKIKFLELQLKQVPFTTMHIPELVRLMNAITGYTYTYHQIYKAVNRLKEDTK